LAALVLAPVPSPANAHSDEQLSEWGLSFADFDGNMGNFLHGLQSKKGSCCTGFDGHPPEAVFQISNNHYQVRLEGQWVDVPPEAVIDEPNKYGAAVVWYSVSRAGAQGYWDGSTWHPTGPGETTFNIRCFLPGELY
jgi:hypothetical protein